jgi:hypothetical protein
MAWLALTKLLDTVTMLFCSCGAFLLLPLLVSLLLLLLVAASTCLLSASTWLSPALLQSMAGSHSWLKLAASPACTPAPAPAAAAAAAASAGVASCAVPCTTLPGCRAQSSTVLL